MGSQVNRDAEKHWWLSSVRGPISVIVLLCSIHGFYFIVQDNGSSSNLISTFPQNSIIIEEKYRLEDN